VLEPDLSNMVLRRSLGRADLGELTSEERSRSCRDAKGFPLDGVSGSMSSVRCLELVDRFKVLLKEMFEGEDLMDGERSPRVLLLLSPDDGEAGDAGDPGLLDPRPRRLSNRLTLGATRSGNFEGDGGIPSPRMGLMVRVDALPGLSS
jgi:hypothetical protein